MDSTSLKRRNLSARTMEADELTDELEKFDELKNKSRRFSQVSLGSSVNLEFQHLNYSVKQGRNKGNKIILSNISGNINSGELTAILGPSGAGKTALMNILAGYKSIGSNKQYEISGSILVNGNERDARKFRKKSCYIMQDDYLLPNFTVRETMETAANLKLPEKTPKEEKEQTITDILEALRLKEIENSKVSTLSGGERKRLCIAQELVNNPPIMFFDEPTSGLDSSSCDQCISLLKALVAGGRTIVCTIHQPNSKIFEKFDKLIVISEGQCIYRGSTSGLVPFLASLQFECPPYHNPADFVIEVVSENNGINLPKIIEAVNSGKCDRWNDTIIKSKDSKNDFHEIITEIDQSNGQLASSTAELRSSLSNQQEINDLDDSEYVTNTWTQFRILFIRSFQVLIRNKIWTILRFATHIILSAVVGFLFYGIGNNADDIFSNLGCIFFILLFFMFTAAIPVVLLFPLERHVVEREYLNSWYNIKAYYFAKVMADTPFQIILPIIFSSIIYWMTNQPNDLYRFSLFLAMSISVTSVSQAIGFMIGAGADIQAGVFLCAVLNVPFAVFSGFFVSYYTIPIYMRWFCFLSYMFYAFEGFIVILYGFDRDYLDCPDQLCLIDSPSQLLDELEILNRNVYPDFLGLLCCFVLFRTLGYFILRWKLKLKF